MPTRSAAGGLRQALCQPQTYLCYSYFEVTFFCSGLHTQVMEASDLPVKASLILMMAVHRAMDPAMVLANAGYCIYL